MSLNINSGAGPASFGPLEPQSKQAEAAKQEKETSQKAHQPEEMHADKAAGLEKQKAAASERQNILLLQADFNKAKKAYEDNPTSETLHEASIKALAYMGELRPKVTIANREYVQLFKDIVNDLKKLNADSDALQIKELNTKFEGSLKDYELAKNAYENPLKSPLRTIGYAVQTLTRLVENLEELIKKYTAQKLPIPEALKTAQEIYGKELEGLQAKKAVLEPEIESELKGLRTNMQQARREYLDARKEYDSGKSHANGEAALKALNTFQKSVRDYFFMLTPSTEQDFKHASQISDLYNSLDSEHDKLSQEKQSLMPDGSLWEKGEGEYRKRHSFEPGGSRIVMTVAEFPKEGLQEELVEINRKIEDLKHLKELTQEVIKGGEQPEDSLEEIDAKIYKLEQQMQQTAECIQFYTRR